jgi:ABC-2 type transport system ATP-binding protein
MPLIEFHNVTKMYRHHFWSKNVAAVSELSFSVEQGKIVGFVGPNGAGKTTSLKMLMGLAMPTRGRITINNRPADQPLARTGISFLSEQPYFYEHLTVYESILFAYRLAGLPMETSGASIEKALATVRLSGVENKKVKELSKGMQQRLNMACALLGDAYLFVLDEPMSGLDPLGRTLFRSIFQELVKSGKTIFFSTHILDDIESLCDGIIVLANGRLKFQGAISSLLADGFLGTDIVVRAGDAVMREALESMGYAITEPYPGRWNILVPKEKDPCECQKWLHERAIFCESIARRHASLETLLYGSQR